MSQLRYHKRAYFRSSQSDAESFKPYFIAIIAIIALTFLGVGIQNTVISGFKFDKTSAALQLRCKQNFTTEINITNCTVANKNLPSILYAINSPSVEQDLHKLIN
jgi:hypothetical protein